MSFRVVDCVVSHLLNVPNLYGLGMNMRVELFVKKNKSQTVWIKKLLMSCLNQRALTVRGMLNLIVSYNSKSVGFRKIKHHINNGLPPPIKNWIYDGTSFV